MANGLLIGLCTDKRGLKYGCSLKQNIRTYCSFFIVKTCSNCMMGHRQFVYCARSLNTNMNRINCRMSKAFFLPLPAFSRPNLIIHCLNLNQRPELKTWSRELYNLAEALSVCLYLKLSWTLQSDQLCWLARDQIVKRTV